MVEFVYDDGGRKAAGYKGNTGDCGVRALAIAAEMDYQWAYDLIGLYCQGERRSKRRKSKSHPRTGIHTATFKKIMAGNGFTWVPTMAIGTGCKVHLKADELPGGAIIVRLSKHYAAVVDGVLRDTFDDSRNGTRCVYGYWCKAQ